MGKAARRRVAFVVIADSLVLFGCRLIGRAALALPGDGGCGQEADPAGTALPGEFLFKLIVIFPKVRQRLLSPVALVALA